MSLALLMPVFASAETPAEIVGKAMQNMLKANRKRDDYVYKEKSVVRDMDAAGNVTKTHETEKEVMVFAGEQVERIIEKDGKPLPDRDARKQEEKVDRAASEAGKLTPEQLQARLAKRDREIAKTNGWLTELASAYHFVLEDERVLDGSPVYVIKGTPDPGYKGKDAHTFRCVEGTLYIDKSSYTLAKMDADFLSDCSFGLFLAKVDKGSRMQLLAHSRQQRGMASETASQSPPTRESFSVNCTQETDIEYSDYRKFSAESKIVSTSSPQ